MIVTVNTDASYSKLYQKGTYAFWIVSDQGRICKSGILRNDCPRPEIAEFRCLINAMHKLVESRWEGITKIIINTDCLNVIQLIQRDKKAFKKYKIGVWGNELLTKWENMIQSYRSTILKGVKIECRHVKSHVSTDSKRQWVNDWCDKEAKKQMSEYLRTQLIIKEEINQ